MKITDKRTEGEQELMDNQFQMYETEYRNDDWAEVVYEDSTIVLIEDTKGYEFDEWQSEFDDDFSQRMHEMANQLVDRRWPSSYPLVFTKGEHDG